MPVDFGRVPPRVAVPPPPRLSVLVWALLLVVIMGVGAALTITLWPARVPLDALFWLCCVGYAPLLWGCLLFLRLGHGHLQCRQTIADNAASDRIEAGCHAEAGVPLAVLGHAWCFAGDEKENDVDGIVSGATLLDLRSSGTAPGTDVQARWLEIPGQRFPPGNARAEVVRQQVIGDWLLDQLIERIRPGLLALPADCDLHVHLSLQAMRKPEELRGRLEARIAAIAPALRITTMASASDVSLFEVDAWHDSMTPHEVHLLVAIQLRPAISKLLANGVAEAGTALLVARPGVASNMPASGAALHLHRPAKGSFDDASQAMILAARWGQIADTPVPTIWAYALTEDATRQIKAAPDVSPQAKWIDIDTVVGDCADAGAWLATALAIEQASRTGFPQAVLSQHGNDIVALVCRKQV
ncbi:hypothetical protein CupriaWKF_25795 [Cupriavidus sp. WKF15]|uniref:hypothetical protein n=1 Tax=Cupriavidus sp. WKF15 TaxID=3032282 RepID=UPI0023E14091|nr:hypothetical protein [Cupriavidus sp. WKF15]WER48214.1 hypothetical protein CupriaWKF_25795 [Cupriavidus sp. WKF15]